MENLKPASTWNFVGLFLGRFAVNFLLVMFLLIFCLLESMDFSLPTGKSNSYFYHETNTSRILCIILIITNLCIFIKMSLESKSSKVLGFVAGCILPLSLGGYLIFAKK